MSRGAWWTVLVAILIAAAGVGRTTMAQEPVNIRVQVIEGTNKSTEQDPRIASLKTAIVGYTGAKLLDELEVKVEPKASISLEILGRSQILKVTVLDVDKDGTVKLRVAIDSFKFSANTTHKKNNATVVLAHKTGPDTALFLAVTPKL